MICARTAWAYRNVYICNNFVTKLTLYFCTYPILIRMRRYILVSIASH